MFYLAVFIWFLIKNLNNITPKTILKIKKQFKGRLQMWVDIFPMSLGPPGEAFDITPRKSKKLNNLNVLLISNWCCINRLNK
jgi:hypothetical protein